MNMRIRSVVATLVAAVVLIVPATAAAAPQVGMSEQDTAMFSNKLFKSLKVRHARVVVGWDVLRNPPEKAYLDTWLAGAKTAKVRPVVSFNHSRIAGQEAKLPSVAAFKREVRAFRKAYPQVKDFVTWNEGNHISQPTFKKPARAAQYSVRRTPDAVRLEDGKSQIVVSIAPSAGNVVCQKAPNRP